VSTMQEPPKGIVP